MYRKRKARTRRLHSQKSASLSLRCAVTYSHVLIVARLCDVMVLAAHYCRGTSTASANMTTSGSVVSKYIKCRIDRWRIADETDEVEEDSSRLPVCIDVYEALCHPLDCIRFDFIEDSLVFDSRRCDGWNSDCTWGRSGPGAGG